MAHLFDAGATLRLVKLSTVAACKGCGTSKSEVCHGKAKGTVPTHLGHCVFSIGVGHGGRAVRKKGAATKTTQVITSSITAEAD